MKPRKRYTPEFKTQALELLAAGKPVPELVEELCVSSNLLYNWRAGTWIPQAGSASGPKRTTCGICAAKMPGFRWRMTF